MSGFTVGTTLHLSSTLSLLLIPATPSVAAAHTPPPRPQVTLEYLNQSPGANLFKHDDRVVTRIALVAKTEDWGSQVALAFLLASTKVRIPYGI